MLILLLVFAVTCPAYAERPVPPRAGVYSITADTEYFQTNADFSDSGSVTSLPLNTGYENITAGLRATYDFNKFFRLFTGFTFSDGSSRSFDPNDLTFTKTISRSNSGANEATIGGLGWINAGPVSIAPHLSMVYPFWRVDEVSDNPLIGEGAMKIRAGSWAVWRALKWLQPFAFAGYEYRDGGRSSLLPYNIGAHFRLNDWWIQGEYRGTEAITDDSDYAQRGPRDIFLRDVNGGSFRYYSVNPSSSEAAIETGYNFGGFGVHAGFAMTVGGTNSADGNLFYGGVTYRGRIKLAPAAPAEDSQDKFEVQKDRYDESLFQEEGEGKKIKRKVRKSPSVDKLLHETEKDLQQGN